MLCLVTMSSNQLDWFDGFDQFNQFDHRDRRDSTIVLLFLYDHFSGRHLVDSSTFFVDVSALPTIAPASTETMGDKGEQGSHNPKIDKGSSYVS